MSNHINPKNSKKILPVFALFFSIAIYAWDIPSLEKTKDPSEHVKNASCLSYPMENEFQKRAKIILEGLSGGSLEKWRTGYFSKGDPGKYLPGHAMAKLILNPDDPEPAKYMNDERSYKEHYHFAAVNWARFIPIFRDLLTDDTFEKFSNEAAKYNSYIKMGGTENHKVMWWTSANVLPYYTNAKRFGGTDLEEALKISKETLKKYVKGLFDAGQGEWDSSTYLTFDVNGMLNIYDFSKDEECRLLAKAALDWYLTTYALKYRDGIFCAPNQRGFSNSPYESLMDQTGFLWWGGNKVLENKDCRDFRYSVHAITSSYRPNKIITNLALKKIKALPLEQINSKPNYWHGLSIPPIPSLYREVMYLSENYSIGSLLNGYGGQITKFQIVFSSSKGGISFEGGSPRRSDHTGKKIDFGYRDGIGRYDQLIQAGAVSILISKIPDDEEYPYVFFTIPQDYLPSRFGEWFVFDIEKALLALYPLGAEGEIAFSELTEKQKQENSKEEAKGKPPKHNPIKFIKISAKNSGFIVQTAEKTRFKSLDDFVGALKKTKIDQNQIANGKILYADIEGRNIEMIFNPSPIGDNHADYRAELSIDGKKVVYDENKKIYSGPVITQEGGILKVSDGEDSFTIDFSGEMPIYK